MPNHFIRDYVVGSGVSRSQDGGIFVAQDGNDTDDQEQHTIHQASQRLDWTIVRPYLRIESGQLVP